MSAPMRFARSHFLKRRSYLKTEENFCSVPKTEDDVPAPGTGYEHDVTWHLASHPQARSGSHLDDADADHEVGRSYPEARLPGWQWVPGRDLIVALFFIGGRDDDRRFRRIGRTGSRVRRVRGIRRDRRQGWRVLQQRCLGVHLDTRLNR